MSAPAAGSLDVLLDRICAALRTVRLGRWGLMEQEIHARLSYALTEHGIRHVRECTFAPGCRADFWVDGVVVEVKKQRPALAAVTAQVARYARQPGVRGVVLVLERHVPLAREIGGKPVRVVSLNSLHGVAV